jgi:alkylation response protein AidB-like acyl-CoA dehydrogenase
MDFSLTPEQQALRESVQRFCEREYQFDARRKLLSSSEGFARAHWATFVELGWLGAGLAEEVGGYGGSPIESALILEQMAKALVLEPFLSCAIIASQAIIAQASQEQRDRLIGSIIGGEIIAALAHDEPGSRGLDVLVETVARRQGNSIHLTGQKSFVLGGPSADLLLVSARSAASDGSLRDDVSLFCVDPKASDIRRHDYRAVDGRRVSDFVFTDLRLEPDALLGEEGKALAAIERAYDHGRIGLCAEAVGAMDAALWQTRDYLKIRKQFGTTLGSFQALQHKMADMLIETELARSMLYRGLAALIDDDPLQRRKIVSAVKAQIGEAAHFVTGQAIQLHGGIGVTEEYNIGHYFKRAVLIRGLYGASDSHLSRFARLSHPAPASIAHSHA